MATQIRTSIILTIFATSSLFSQYTITQVTTDSVHSKWPALNKNGDIVWSQQVGSFWQIFKKGPTTNNAVVQITIDARNHERPVISDNGTIVWFQDNSGAGLGWQVVGCGPNCQQGSATFTIEISTRNSFTGDHRDAGKHFGISAANGTTISHYSFCDAFCTGTSCGAFCGVRRFNLSGFGMLSGDFRGYDHPDVNSQNLIVYRSPAGQIVQATPAAPFDGIVIDSGEFPHIADVTNEIVYIKNRTVFSSTTAIPENVDPTCAATTDSECLWADVNDKRTVVFEKEVGGISQIFLATVETECGPISF